MKWLFVVVLFLGFIGGLVLALGYTVVQHSVPPENAEVRLPGLTDSVDVVFDANAVPHIQAKSQVEAARILGYLHARDRLWQMEVLRMAGQGRLSEMFGKATLYTDRFLRTLGMANASRSSYDKLLPETQKVLQAYAQGVNAYISRDTRMLESPLPIEYLILGHNPEAWEPWQSVLVIKLMGLTLSSNMAEEIKRFTLAIKGYKPGEIDALLPYGPHDNPPPLPDMLKLYEFKEEESVKQTRLHPKSHELARYNSHDTRPFDWPVGQTASNNWVISGKRTDTGKPILANDPHLGLTAPSTFYLAHLSWQENGEKRDVIGGSIPGVPFMVVGRTNKVAWGLTTTNLDAQDLYVEKMTEDGKSYLTEDGWAPLNEETFVLKGGGDDETLTIRRTRNGPILPRSYKGIGSFLPDRVELSLRWTGLSDEDTTLDSLYLNNRAQSVNEFLAAGKYSVSPMQSIVVADTQGNIALTTPARSPKRFEANQVAGRAPVPGWLPQYQWEGVLSANQQFKSVNPDEGALATANANFFKSKDHPFITYDWAEHFRQQRAEELVIGRTTPHTLQSSIEIMADTYSPAMIRFRNLVKRIVPTGVGGLAEIRSVIDRWDGQMKMDRPEPLIMLAWFRHLNIAMLEDDLGDLFFHFERGRITPLIGMLERGGARDWCDNKNTSEIEKCADVLNASLQSALDELSELYGDDWRQWNYGNAHLAYGEHRPFGKVGALASIFNITVPSEGGPYTLLRGQTKFQEENPYLNRHASAYRGVYDMSDPDKSLFIQSTGQSGHVASPHYRDFASKWSKMEFVPMSVKPQDYMKNANGTWKFKPKQQ